MDLQSRFFESLARLLPDSVEKPSIHYEVQNRFGNVFKTICIYGFYQGQSISGAGTSRSWLSSFWKAFSEIGESILCQDHKINSIGLSGGLFESLAIKRARHELIERESYSFHCENQKPFVQRVFEDQEIVSFLMQSSVRNIFPIITLDRHNRSVMGLGSSDVLSEALYQSQAEYLMAARTHIQGIQSSEVLRASVPVHKMSSRGDFFVSFYRSPLIFMKYAKVSRGHFDR